MNMKPKRMQSVWKLAILLPVAAALSASCSSNKEAATKAPETAATPDIMSQPIELTHYYMYSDRTYEQFMEASGNIIRKKYPNITFKYIRNEKGSSLEEIAATKVKVDFFGGVPADIDKLRTVGLLGDATDLVAKTKYDLGKLEQTSINGIKLLSDGKVTGLPIKINSATLFYNKDMFDKFGVPYLTDTMTWEDILDTARKLTRVDGGMTYLGIGLQIANLLTVNETAPRLVNPQTHKAELNTDYWKRMFERIAPSMAMVNDTADKTVLANYGNAIAKFRNEGTVGIMVANNSAYPQPGASWAINWDIAQFPDYKDLPKAGPSPSPYSFYLSANSPNREAAFLAIASLLTPEAQVEQAQKGQVSSLQDKSINNSIGSGVAELKGKNAKGLVPKRYGEMIAADKYINAANSALTTALTEVLTGKKDVNTALRDGQELADQKISELPK
ncbi:MAG: extracellular solute-binding protein family 1 [Paenibacillus sp.]|nr:extracellular solute-binding protein family 1 [Paenibacillus sp.]